MDERFLPPALYVLDGSYSDPDKLTLEDAERHLYHIQILDAPTVDISSTEIRDGLAHGEDMSRFMM